MKKNEWSDIQLYQSKRAPNGLPYITIRNKRGKEIFYVNADFFTELGIKGTVYVQLAYSKKMNAIIFDFSNKNTAGGLKMKDESRTFSGVDFISHYNIKLPNNRRRYEPKLVQIPKLGKRWVIFLS